MIGGEWKRAGGDWGRLDHDAQARLAGSKFRSSLDEQLISCGIGHGNGFIYLPQTFAVFAS